MCVQEESIALLCTMADFAFYRPSIRDAQPTEALADMIHAGCSQVTFACLFCDSHASWYDAYRIQLDNFVCHHV